MLGVLIFVVVNIVLFKVCFGNMGNKDEIEERTARYIERETEKYNQNLQSLDYAKKMKDSDRIIMLQRALRYWTRVSPTFSLSIFISGIILTITYNNIIFLVMCGIFPLIMVSLYYTKKMKDRDKILTLQRALRFWSGVSLVLSSSIIIIGLILLIIQKHIIFIPIVLVALFIYEASYSDTFNSTISLIRFIRFDLEKEREGNKDVTEC